MNITRRPFKLGKVVATRGVADSIPPEKLMVILSRHQSNDWGELDPRDWKENDRAVEKGDRLLSSYTIDGEKVWIITEWDRSVTTILYPSEY